MQPQEQLLELKKGDERLYIGIPKEITYQENRVPLTPAAVQLLISNGHDIVIESNSGKNANFFDKDYSDAGARIVYSKEEVYQAGIIVKVDPPTKEEIAMMKKDQLLISALQLTNLSETYLKQLVQKKVTAIGFEYMRDSQGTLSVIQTMSEIAGSTSILIGAEYLSNTGGGKGELLGGVAGIPPSEVVIIGAGTVGEYAARTAIGLGAIVKVFDNSPARLRRLQNNLNQRVYTSIIVPNILSKALKSADLAIGSLRHDDGRSHTIVTEEMVANMKPNSVIVDITIDQGGCFETSEVTNHTNPIFRKHDVIHYCVPNIPSRVSRTASYALSNILTPILLGISEAQGLKNYLQWENQSMRKGIYIYKGVLVKRVLAERFSMEAKDIDFLLGANF
jgi:alanine dehydrogenase